MNMIFKQGSSGKNTEKKEKVNNKTFFQKMESSQVQFLKWGVKSLFPLLLHFTLGKKEKNKKVLHKPLPIQFLKNQCWNLQKGKPWIERMSAKWMTVQTTLKDSDKVRNYGEGSQINSSVYNCNSSCEREINPLCLVCLLPHYSQLSKLAIIKILSVL